MQGIERLWLGADGVGGPFVPGLVVEGVGDPGDVASVLPVVHAAHPRATRHLRGFGPWLRWAPGGPGIVLGAGEVSPRHAPVRLVVDPGPPTRIVLHAHHALGDGQTMLAWMRSIFAALRGEPLVPHEEAPSDEALAAQAAWADPPRDLPPVLGEVTEVGRATRFVQGRAPPGRAVLRRFLAALSAEAGGPMRVSLPVNLRPPGALWDGNFTGIATVRGPDDLEGVRDPARCAGILALGRRVAWLPAWVIGTSGWHAARAQQQAGRFDSTATVSNLGRVHRPWFDAGTFRCARTWWIPPPAPGVPLFVLLTGDDEGVDVSLGAPTGLASGGRIEALLARLLARIGAAADT